MKLKYVLTTNKAKGPCQAEGSAGYDLFADESKELKPQQVTIVTTGLCVQIPENHVGIVCDKSGRGYSGIRVVGLSDEVKNPNDLTLTGLTIMGRIIDANYRGELNIMFGNVTDKSVHVYEGEKVAQLLVVPYLTIETEQVDQLEDSNRGTGWKGSTGLR